MKFNVQRVLTPAYLTSIALIVIGVLLGLAWYPVAAWVFVLLGLALNAMAVSVTEIHDAPRAGGRRPTLPSRASRTRRPADEPEDDPEADPGTDPLGAVVTEPPREGLRRATAEPEAETAATPTVPHTGSRAHGPRR
ncbi:hypothetical protein ACT4S2_08245 [Kocuria turfanensis]|uniref:Uncharacterized protein n=1 Tax=Kocuria turfanensis TaxID=388357 RepID=A0A512ID26_9MICC|nr:hypothetical protein [Kocuria turfanensis]GEO95603.1 hypothetical protein KTU01_17260 [Kocuria turfanensis]